MIQKLVGIVFLSLVVSAKLPNLDANLGQVSTSGISSGAYMAVQFHVGFSGTVKGAGVVAGGPYHCAQGSSVTAITTCMSSPGSINVDTLEQYIFSQSGKGIDDSSNIQGSKVYIFAGTKDTVVNPQVGHHAEDLYGKLGANVKTEYSIGAEHSMVTKNYGNACGYKGSPYINKCDYDAAYELLNHIYGGNLAAPVDMVDANLKEYDQSPYDSADSFAAKGYTYIPEACNGGGCSVHVAFHGCQQGYETIGDKYVKHSGYNEVAEANNIIIIYPQVKVSYFAPSNPQGCWDWWGYNDGYFSTPDYDLKNGPQMKAVMQMVQDLGNGQTQ